jgi:hypothetical protein
VTIPVILLCSLRVCGNINVSHVLIVIEHRTEVTLRQTGKLTRVNESAIMRCAAVLTGGRCFEQSTTVALLVPPLTTRGRQAIVGQAERGDAK